MTSLPVVYPTMCFSGGRPAFDSRCSFYGFFAVGGSRLFKRM